jgi:hypothetical protein
MTALHLTTHASFRLWDCIKTRSSTLDEQFLHWQPICYAIRRTRKAFLVSRLYSPYWTRYTLISSRTQSPGSSDSALVAAQLPGLTVEVRSKRDGFCDGFFISLAEAARRYLPSLEFVEVICCIDEYNENGSLPLHLCHLRRMFAVVA